MPTSRRSNTLRRSSRRFSTLFALLLALVVSALVAACGGSDSGEDVNKVLDQTFQGEQNVNSGKLNLDATAKLEGAAQLQGPVNVKMTGPVEGLEKKVADTGEIPKADLDVTASAAGQSFRAGFTSTGDKLYVNFRGTDYVVPDAQFQRLKRQLQKAQEDDAKSKSPDLAALGIRPRNWLTNAKDEGTEDVGGVETIHVSGGVDIDKMLDDFDRLLKRAGDLNLSQQQLRQLPQGIPNSTRKQIEDAVEDAKLDLYSGKDDKVLRKLAAKIKFNVPEALRQQAGGLKSGELDFTVTLTDVNEPQTIEAPKNAKPISELQRQLQSSGFGSLGGGSGSSGSGSSGSSGSGSGASSAKSRRYLKCVQKAQGTAELNACSDLLK
jgi:hypothetical protein